MPKIPAYQKQPLYVKAFKSYSITNRQTDTQTEMRPNTLPRRILN